MLLMKQLDEDGSGYRSMIEREIRERLASQAGAAEAVQPGPAEPSPAICRCGTTNDPDALFCKKCGGRLADADPAPAAPTR